MRGATRANTDKAIAPMDSTIATMAFPSPMVKAVEDRRVISVKKVNYPGCTSKVRSLP